MVKTFGEYWDGVVAKHPELDTIENIRLAGEACIAGMEYIASSIKDKDLELDAADIL